MIDSLPKNSDLDGRVVSATMQSSGSNLTEQANSLPSMESNGRYDMNVFFGIGMLINIVMIIAFFIWAVKQWKANDKSKK